MAHKFQLNQRVIIKGFESHGTITTMPFNDEMETYIVTFDKPQLYSINIDGKNPQLYPVIVADAEFLELENN